MSIQGRRHHLLQYLCACVSDVCVCVCVCCESVYVYELQPRVYTVARLRMYVYCVINTTANPSYTCIHPNLHTPPTIQPNLHTPPPTHPNQYNTPPPAHPSSHTLIQPIRCPSKHIVQLIRHATRLGHKPHTAWAVELTGHNVIYGACCVTNLESTSLL